jgi:parallel beta-helix repeat protein
VDITNGGDSNVIRGNYIGTQANGTTALANSFEGIRIVGASNSNTIGGSGAGEGNVISGNSGNGIALVNGPSSTTIQGNFVGTKADGAAALGNNSAGVFLGDSASNTIGGTSAGARNVLSGNALFGVYITGSGSTSNVVQGNYIGLKADGSASVGTQVHGVVLVDGPASNTIGGSAAGARNIISGNTQDGIQIVRVSGPGVSGNTVQGNYIGPDPGGTLDLGNGRNGILLSNGVTNNTIGGADLVGQRNVISGNNQDGIRLEGGATTGNTIRGNFVGTTAAGNVALGNSSAGVRITTGANSNGIGGVLTGAGNTIAFNTGDGVALDATAGNGNAISSNSIFSNGQLGIDLGDNGVTANDAGDGDTGPNNQQNFPVLTSAVLGSTIIQGTLNSVPNTTFTLEFFASPAADPTGFGEGQRFLGRTNVTTNGSGAATINVTLATSVAAGERVTATATNLTTNDTSEFSAAILANTSGPVVDLDANNSSGQSGNNFATTWTENGGPKLLADSDATITDADSSMLQSLTVTLTTRPDGAAEVLTANTAGTPIVASPYNGSTGVLLLSGAATVAQYQQVLRTVTYNSTSEAPTTTARTITFVTNDGTFNSATATTTLTILSANDPPSFTKGANQTVTEDAGAQTVAGWATNISPGPGNEGSQTVTFLIQGNTNPGLFSAGPAISPAGTLTYTPASNANGSATITIALQDNGGTANGGQNSSGNQSFVITVNPVNDAPVITSNGGGVTASISLPENTTAVTTVTSTDLDGGAQIYGLAGGADAAKFTIHPSTGVLTFLTAPDFEAPFNANGDNVYEVTVQVSDGAGGLDTQALSITVTDVLNTLTVTTTSDVADGVTTSIEALNASRGADGQISLREAILAANQTENDIDRDVIGFNIAGAGVRTIQPTSALPAITGLVVLDGATQPGYMGLPLIELSGINAGAGVTGLIVHAGGSGTIIRALAINRFAGNGIRIDGGGNNLLEGNFIGTNAAGTAAAPNGLDGLTIVESVGNLIGGVTLAARNLISGNVDDGIEISGSLASANQILGNYIGTDITGTMGLGNGANGIAINGAGGTMIGSATVAGGANRIAFNVGAGIAVLDGSSNRIEGNAILSNGGLGIDLGVAGVTANDDTDLDTGANALQNAPVLTSAWLDGTVVNGTLNSLPGQTFILDFFASAAGDATGFGEGERWLGRGVVTTDPAGTATFQINLEAPVALDEIVTATATDALGNTSEFSAGVPVTADGVAMYALSVFTNGTGRGNVSALPSGIDLAKGDDTEFFPKNTVVTLRATPESGFEFAGWSGFGVFETSPTLTVPVYEARRYAATFVPANSGEKVPPTVRAVQVKSHWAKSLTVTWDRLLPPTGFVVAGYRVYLSSDQGLIVRTAQTTAQKTSFTFTGLDPVRYRVTVSAILVRENNPDQTSETGWTPFISIAPIAGLEGWRVRNEGTAPSPPPLLGRSDWANVDVDPRRAVYAAQYDYGQFSMIGTPTDQGLAQRGTFLQSIGGIAQNRTDYELTVQIGSAADGAVGIMIRSVDPNNYYRFSMERDPDHDGNMSDAYIRLVKMVNGQPTVLLQDNNTPAELKGSNAAYEIGSPYVVTIDATAPSLFVTVRDDSGLSIVDWRVTDSTFTGNGLALYSSENPGSLYTLFALGRENPDPNLLDVDLYVTGTGRGMITSTVNGDPGSLGTDSTSASIPRDAVVTLTATPLPGYGFGGWFSRSLDGQTRGLLTTGPTVTLPPLMEDLIVEAVFTGTPPPSHSLDINGDQEITADVDGRLALRFLAGTPDSQLSGGSVSPQAMPSERTSAVAIRSYLTTAGLTMMDVDGDGQLNPFTDGRLIYRFLQQLDLDQQGPTADQALVQGAIGPEAQRTAAAGVRQYLGQFVPGLAAQSANAGLRTQDSGLSAPLTLALSPEGRGDGEGAPTVEGALPSAFSLPTSALSPQPSALSTSAEASLVTRQSSLPSELSANNSQPSALQAESSVVSAPLSVTVLSPEPRASNLVPSAVVPMGFASLTVQTADLSDDSDITPLATAPRPWLTAFVVSSAVAEDPNRDLVVAVG